MAVRLGPWLFLLFVALVILNISLVEAHGHGGHRRHGSWHGSCWSSHHSCSRWSTWGTGIKHCHDRCRYFGYPGGSCQMCPNSCRGSRGSHMCSCYNAGSCY